jgi:cell division protein ZipA
LLLDTAVSLGLRYGAMKIFHRHSEEDGSGPVLFSMANLLNPGTFDLTTMGALQSVGVTLFMTPNELEEPVEAFDIMLETAEKLAQELQLTLKDESRSSMTKQTIDHYRQKALKIAFQRQRNT